MGRVTVNTAPPSCLLSPRITPPWASTMVRHTDRPIPMLRLPSLLRSLRAEPSNSRGSRCWRRKIKVAQGLHHLDVLTRKLQNGNIPVPETVEQERYYISGSKKS